MSKESLTLQRHSAAHILAAAVLKLFPDAKLGMGPAIEDGFYYDFELEHKFSLSDLPKIEAEMRKIIAANPAFKKETRSKSQAEEILKDQPYKKELLADLDAEVSFYKTADFVDLCKGPHVENAKDIGAFRLTRVAGAYWKGNENNPMLQRIYGVLFNTESELKEHLAMLEEAKKRDHRKLGSELGLFVFSDLLGPGLPLYTAKGARLRTTIQNYSRELRRSMGYEEVWTQQINKAELFKISGHYEKYKDDMFKVLSHYTREEYFLKPMNCPQHTQIYASRSRSYRDLPIRISDFSNLYRDEKLGEVSGLSRLRGFSQDDAHCFCRPDQIEAEFSKLLEAVKQAMSTYGLDYWIRLSLWDPNNKQKYLGSETVWEKAQLIMEKLLTEHQIDYRPAEGEAAFYGPKMDLMAKDSIGREWQLSTIQLDLNMPARFGLEYTDESGKPKTPIMIHSAIVGSPEPFMSMAIENYAGAFPFWLAPLQVVVLPVSEKFTDYADKIKNELTKEGIETEVWMEDSLGKRIREAELQKVPISLIAGEKEAGASLVSVRSLRQKDLGSSKLSEFVKTAKSWIKEKTQET